MSNSDQFKKRISSEGMDKKIQKRTWTPKRIGLFIGGMAILGMFIYGFIFMDTRSTLNVEREKLAISTVREDTFQEFIMVNGTVQPIQTIYMDAQESGVVNQVVLESGTGVQRGDTILTLNNSDLRLEVIRQASQIHDDINNIQIRRLELRQSILSQRRMLVTADHELQVAERQFRQNVELDSLNAIRKDELEQSRINYNYQRKMYNMEHESFQTDSIRTQHQLAQIDRSEERLQQDLEATQAILDELTITAPAAGQLSMNEFHPGQSVGAGERIGQIDIVDRYKVRVGIDEYHLSRISPGLEGSFDEYELLISKVYPVVENGQFELDMEFAGDSPKDLRRGQTVRIRLELGASEPALLLERGGFYQATGGNWVYRLSEEGDQAVRQPIQLGRQNPEYFEVRSGLEPGDKVITSSYDTFGENEVLNLQ